MHASVTMSAGRSAALALLALGASACGRGSESPPVRPSIVLVSLDTLRADHVGLYGYERATTPFLDRWAEDALVFERAFTTAAWTLVAHMTMLTGLFPEQHGVYGQHRALSDGIPLLAERLRAAGYRTYALYFEGWIHERHGFHRGFDVFQKHATLDEADAQLRALLPELEREGPFFLFVHLFDVHCGDLEKGAAPYTAPEPYQSMFAAGLPPLPDGPVREFWETPGALTPEQLETLVAHYDGGIRHVDDQLGRWFAELEGRGLVQDALAIVTSDHGEALGEHGGKLNHHGDSWQAALHIPLIVRPPGGSAGGKRVATPVHLGDVVPTVLDAAGLPEDPQLPGVSLLGPIPDARVVYGIKLPEAFVLKWPEKVVLRNVVRKAPFLALDLEQDPRERAPRPGDPARFEELKAEAMAPGFPFPAAPKIVVSAEDLARLHALGYGGEDEPEPPKAPPADPPRPK